MTCEHKNVATLSQSIENRVCLTCGHHWYEGKEYTRAEWDEWMNSEFDAEAMA